MRNYIKLHFGVPILRASNDKFRERYDRIVKPHSYETKIEMMELLDVTSELSKQQFSSLLDQVIDHYTAEGYRLARE